MFTYALTDRAAARPGNTVKSLCAHPGPVDSGLQGKTALAGGTRLLDRYVLASTLKIAQSTEDGTCGIARCTCEPGIENGSFYGPDPDKRTGPAVLLAPERNAEWKAFSGTKASRRLASAISSAESVPHSRFQATRNRHECRQILAA